MNEVTKRFGLEIDFYNITDLGHHYNAIKYMIYDVSFFCDNSQHVLCLVHIYLFYVALNVYIFSGNVR